MKACWIGLAAALAMGIAGTLAVAGGTVTIAVPQRNEGILRVRVSLSSDTSGDADGTILSAYHDGETSEPVWISGLLRRVTVHYDSTATPTTLWDVRLLDAVSTDVLSGRLCNLSTATTWAVNWNFDPPIAVRGPFTVQADNMGSTTRATVNLYVEKPR